MDQDLIFIPPVDSDGNVVQVDEESDPWQDTASDAYAPKNHPGNDVRFKDLTDETRHVLERELNSPNELIFSTVSAFNLIDKDKSGTVSYSEVEAAQTEKWLRGQDALVIAGLLERNAFDRIATFSNDQRGKETELSRKDVWEMAEKYNNGAYSAETPREKRNMEAIGTVFYAALAKQERDKASAGM